MSSKFLTYLKSAFSEVDGSGSATRVLAGATVLTTLIWVSYLVCRTHALPDLGGASMFVSAGFSGYAINKVAGVASGKDKDKN